MERTKQFIERRIVKGLITDETYCKKICPIYKPELLKDDAAKRITSIAVDYWKQWHKPIREDIGIEFEKLKNKIPNEEAEDIQDILDDLSIEYQSQDKNIDGDTYYLIVETLKHFQCNQFKRHLQDMQNAIDRDNMEEAEKIRQDFEPVVLEDENKQGGLLSEILERPARKTEYLIPELMPKGLTIFAGKSKVGKTLFITNIIIAMAAGKPAFSEYEIDGKGKTLFLSLEDDENRFVSRYKGITESLGGLSTKKQALIDIRRPWPRLNEGGLKKIEDWLRKEKRAKLVVIDTLQKIRGNPGRMDQYAYDYATLGPLYDLAHKYEVSIICLHHTTKMSYDDPFENILGSTGMQGAADNICILAKEPHGQASHRFSIRGKDIEEKHLAFNMDYPIFSFVGDASEGKRSIERQIIIDFLKDAGRVMQLKDIQAGLGDKGKSAHNILPQLVKSGHIVKVATGKYCHPDVAERKIRQKMDKKAEEHNTGSSQE